jgi:hypothetical protein
MTLQEAAEHARRALEWGSRRGFVTVDVSAEALSVLVDNVATEDVLGAPPTPRVYEWRHHCGAFIVTREGEPIPDPCPLCGKVRPLFWLLHSWEDRGDNAKAS